MISFESLPKDIHLSICRYVSQRDLIQLSITSRHLHDVVTPLIYQQIYISEVPLWHDHIFEGWTAVSHTFGPGDQLKKFEHTLVSNAHLAGMIRSIKTDDIKFVLFKLKSWSTKFRLASLRQFRFAQVPLNHFVTGYDDILRFYRGLPARINLRSLQLSKVGDLVNLMQTANLTSVDSVEFVLADYKDHFGTPNMSVIQFCRQLKQLRVNSAHNMGLTFLEQFAPQQSSRVAPNMLSGTSERVFGAVDVLSVNHCHDQYPLDFDFKSMFDVSRLTELSLSIGCDHADGDQNTTAECRCMKRAFQQLQGTSARSITLTRAVSGPTTIRSVMRWKAVTAEFIAQLCSLDELTLDSTCPFIVADNEEVSESMQCINQRLLAVCMRVRKLHWVDYYESCHAWVYPTITFDDSLESFVSTNERIQYYLNPLIHKSRQQFKHEIMVALLTLLRCHPRHMLRQGNSSMSDDPLVKWQQPGAQATAEEGEEAWPQCIIDAMMQQHHQRHQHHKNELHDLFRHETYTQLVNYQFVKSMVSRQWQIEGHGSQVQIKKRKLTTSPMLAIDCQCDGGEWGRCVALLKQAMAAEWQQHHQNQASVKLNGIYI